MDGFLIEWGSMLLRWLHIIAAMAWIGSSFFFMHLDASLRPVADIPAGKGGAAWQVHGGGFYEMRKFLVAPASMPEELTWHKWQSYWTWLSGFFLLCWIYYAQSELYLVDPAVMKLAGWQASLIGIGALALGWLFYDFLCRSPLGKSEGILIALGFAYVIGATIVFTQVFSGRGAMIHAGALMASFMTGNVFFIIIPNQHKVVAALMKGETPDPAYGKQAKQRSTHNNYITLPVVLLMISNHYPLLWANATTIPVIVALVMVAGALIRHYYNVSHADHTKSPYWCWVVAGLAMVLVFVISMAGSPAGREKLGLAAISTPTTPVALAGAPPEGVQSVLISRCSMCHAAEPSWQGLVIAPKGVMLDTPEAMQMQAAAIHLQAVASNAMPPNNITELTPDERRQLSDWLRKTP